MNILRLVLVNSSVVVTPAGGFLVVIVLTQRSQLPEDSLYFFLLGLVGFMSLLDGGLPYQRLGPVTNHRFIRVMRSLVVNWSWSIVPFTCLVAAFTAFTGYAQSHGAAWTALFVGIAVFAASAKLLADAARVLGLQTKSRSRINGLSSALALIRVGAALTLANRLPFLYAHAAVVAVELVVVLAIVRGPRLRGFRLFLPTLRFKTRIFRDYVVANLGYLMGSSVDRIVAFYFTGAEAYRGIVLQLALYNMAILPHKLVENDMMFDARQAAIRRGVSLLMCAVGAAGLGAALWLQATHHSKSPELQWFLPAAGGLWVAITILYNHQWAAALRSSTTTVLANGTRLAGVAALVAAVALGFLYSQLVLVGAVAYALTNIVLATLDRDTRPRISARSGADYLLLATACCVGAYAIGSQFVVGR